MDDISEIGGAFSELNDRASAYIGAQIDGLPTRWTPEQVQSRLIEAMVVISKTAGRIGPKQFGAAWPAIMLEFQDYLGYDHVQYMKDRRGDIQREADRTFSSIELSRADESMNWASRYLAAGPVMADAIQLWAMCKALHIKIERVLRARCKVADRLRTARAAEADAERDRTMEAKRREIAAGVVLWAEAALSKEADPGARGRIRAGARELTRKRVLEAERAMPRPSRRIKRSDVMPGKVFTNQWLDKQRKLAAAALAGALQRDRVIVR